MAEAFNELAAQVNKLTLAMETMMTQQAHQIQQTVKSTLSLISRFGH